MFVGGCVRKHISNEEIDDIDIATVFTPEEIKKNCIEYSIAEISAKDIDKLNIKRASL